MLVRRLVVVYESAPHPIMAMDDVLAIGKGW